MYPDKRYRLMTRIGVSYATDLRQAKRIIRDILSEQRGILAEPPPKVDFIEFGEYALVLRVVFWLEDYRDRFHALNDFNMAVIDWFRAEDIDIPYPTRTLQVAGSRAQVSDQH